MFRFCEINNRPPTCKEIFEGITIGTRFTKEKTKINCQSDQNYILLSENIILKKILNKYLEKKNIKNKNNVVPHNKEIILNNNENIKNNNIINNNLLSFTDKKKIVFDYSNKYGKIPTSRDKINYGDWFIYEKTKIKSKNDITYQIFAENDIVKKSIDDLLEKRKNK